MTRLKGLWNLVRVALIGVCGYRLAWSVIGVQDAERFLSKGSPPGNDPGSVAAIQEAVNAAQTALHGISGRLFCTPASWSSLP